MEYYSVHAYVAWSQKFRLTPDSKILGQEWSRSLKKWLWPPISYTRGGTGSGVDSGRILRFSFGPRVKILWKPELQSLFNFVRSMDLCGHFLTKTWVNYGWIDDCSQSLNRSRILKLKKFPEPDSKILEQERSRSLKKWLRPLLPYSTSTSAAHKDNLTTVVVIEALLFWNWLRDYPLTLTYFKTYSTAYCFW